VLSANSINKTLTLLSQVLAVAVEYELLPANPATGRRRRVKGTKPRRPWAEPVPKSKTEAGERLVDLSPDLLDELKRHKAGTRFGDPDDLVFPTSRGTMNNRQNVLKRALRPAIIEANKALAEKGLQPIPGTVTMHSLRHTYASLLAEAGADPAYVMAQTGHRSAKLTLEVYTHAQNRKKNATGALDALIRGDDGTPTGTSAQSTAMTEPATVALLTTELPQ
jgi:integrase